MEHNVVTALPKMSTAAGKQLLYEFVDSCTQVVAEYHDINPHAITLSKLRNGKIHKNTSGKKRLGMARVMDRKTIDIGLKEMA